ncbi:hypothetical protein SERLADRAFT_418708 [Serpula lacrymans var. lacrymans S7.9]|uniref:DUF6533 domain-containing protein n=1 Tax=Serpula lacrymans var. lacrymans (strain S7.9) TaxID=578457 RepID=F8PD20_SERL9|nr:uncharacterized protein SERLADRAFT_418708 [Serpula lacrymans var. lacrymans S7.9]EGO19119.1 hypothetical protein SERLADRAFT_418708 [Serpula lacrymans var. lacrymans S7.9]
MSSSSPTFVSGLRVTQYFNVAGLVILIYDYCITLGAEVLWIWGRRWDITRVTFTVARYLAFLGAILTVYSAVTTRTGNCSPFSDVNNVIHIFAIVAAEGLLIQRTYRFWNGSKRLLVWLLGFTVILIVIVVVVPNLVHISHIYSDPGGCIFVGNRTDIIMYGALLLYQFILICLIICSPMTMNIYRDTLMYIACITSITIINTGVVASVPAGYISMFATLQMVLHSVLSSRILFNLRQTEALELQHADRTQATILLKGYNMIGSSTATVSREEDECYTTLFLALSPQRLQINIDRLMMSSTSQYRQIQTLATEDVDVAALNELEEEYWAQVDELDLEGMVEAAIDKPGN